VTAVAGPARSVLRHRNFRFLFSADLASQVGTQVSMVALPLVALLSLKASAFEVGLLFAAQTVAFAVLGLPVGVWVDQMRRRRVLITADLVRGVLLGSIPVAWMFDAITMVQLYVVAMCASAATVFFDVAYQSYLPTLLERHQLVDGNGKLEIVRSSAQVGGPGLGGWLVNLVSAPAAVAVDAISFLFSAALLGRIDTVETKAAAGRRHRLIADIREGLTFVFGQPLLRIIAVRSAAANLAFSVVAAVQVLFLVREVGLSPGVFGTILAAGAVGGLIGGALVGTLSARIGTARLMWLGPLVCQPFALLIPFTAPGPRLLFFVVGALVEGIGIVLYNVSQLSFRQAITPDRLLGRMNATMRFLVWGTMPIGSVLGGLLAQVWGARTALWIGLAGLLLSLLPMLLSPLVRIRDLPTAAVTDVE
jgi:MFS family permease